MSNNRKKPTPKKNSKYGLDLSIKIKEALNSKSITYDQMGKRLKLSKNGFTNRVAKPWYGTIYDLIELSLVLETDFISDAVAYIQLKGIDVSNVQVKAENEILKNEIKQLKNDNDRYKLVIDKLSA